MKNKPKHVPGPCLDKLNTLSNRLQSYAEEVGLTDPEVETVLRSIHHQLGGALMAINREGASREQYLERATRYVVLP
jgi:hypothetical protein